MLNSITLRFTQRPEPVIIPTEGVTIFVGPNNSGKSLALREVEQALINGQTEQGKLVRDFDISMPNAEQLQTAIDLLRKKAPRGLFAVREDWMVVCAVRYEPVSACNSLLTG
jgi:ABC-type enterochelin transport system ATPase subunit